MPTVEQILAAAMPVIQPIVAPGNGSNIAEIWRLNSVGDAPDSDVSDESDIAGGALLSGTATAPLNDVPRTKVGTYAVRIASGSGSLGTSGIGSEHMVGEQQLPKGQFYLFFNAAKVESGSDVLDSDQVHIVAGIYNEADAAKGKTGNAYRWFQTLDAGGEVTVQMERMVRAQEIRGV